MNRAIAILLAATLPAHAGAGRPAAKREITIPRITAPRIDGDITDIAWTEASLKGGKSAMDISNKGSHRNRYPRVFYIGYDHEALYLTVIDFSLDATKLKGGGPKMWWHDDSLEIHLQPDRKERQNVIQVAVTPEGIVSGFDFDDIERDRRKVKARVTRKGIKWVTEIAIPFKFLQVDPPKTGDAWGFNLNGLQKGAGGGLFCWNATYGGFNDSRGFGVIRFGK